MQPRNNGELCLVWLQEPLWKEDLRSECCLGWILFDTDGDTEPVLKDC